MKTIVRMLEDGIYQRPDRAGFWISWIGANGKRHRRKTTAQNITQARAIRTREMARVEQAKLLGVPAPGEDHFSAVAERFLGNQKPRITARSYSREEQILRLHLQPFYDCKLADIRRADIQKYITLRLSAEASSGSVIKELNTLKHLMKLAVEWELIPFSVAAGIKPPRASPGRLRYLQPTELKTLLEAFPDWLRPIIALAAVTGMRRGEILGLRWLDNRFGRWTHSPATE